MINTRGDDVARRSTLRLAACLALGAVVLSGCSEKREASNTLPTASSSAAETTPELPPLGPEDFPVPAEAREKTPEGAVEFVHYYVGLAQHLAMNSMDPQPLLDLSQDCRTCGMVADSLEEDLAASRTYREYEFEFTAYGPGLINGDKAEMGFVYVQGPITVVDAAGNLVPESSGPRGNELQSGAVLLWKDNLSSWVITTLTVG